MKTLSKCHSVVIALQTVYMAEVAPVDEFGIVRHEMQTIVIDLLSICQSVGHLAAKCKQPINRD